jgi:hypothetical protein
MSLLLVISLQWKQWDICAADDMNFFKIIYAARTILKLFFLNFFFGVEVVKKDWPEF